jgi:hypothetical protein
MLAVNTCFKTGHVFRSSQSGFEKTLGYGPACVSDAGGGGGAGRLNGAGGEEKKNFPCLW